MFTKLNILFFSICMSFITINGFSNILRRVLLHEVYKAKYGSELFRVTHVNEIINNGLIIPIVAYEEVLPHPKEGRWLNGVYVSIEDSTKIETKERFLRDKRLFDINCYPILYSCGRCH